MRGRTWVPVVAAAAAVALLGVGVFVTLEPLPARAASPQAHRAAPAVAVDDALQTPRGALPVVTPAITWPPADAPKADPASLPEAWWGGDVGLLAGVVDADWNLGDARTHTLTHAVTVYDADGTPRAHLAARGFTGEPTVVVGIAQLDEWTYVLTPARTGLPSAGDAPAQSAGFVRVADLPPGHPAGVHVEISLRDATLTLIDTATGDVVRSFAAGVGTATRPTPLGFSYVQAVYERPGSSTPELLLGAQSEVADSLNGGSSDAVIAVHYGAGTGPVSNGCVRLSASDVRLLAALTTPGTPVVVVK